MFFICIPTFLTNSATHMHRKVSRSRFDTSFSFKVSFVTNSIHLIEECPEIPIKKRSMSPVKSFEMYKAEKGSQSKGKVSKKRTENTYKKEQVTISIRLMEWNEKENKIKVKRGKRITCVVANDDIKAVILRKAVAKWKHYHKNLYDSDDEMYSLLYESGEVIDKLPESMKILSFTNIEEKSLKITKE